MTTTNAAAIALVLFCAACGGDPFEAAHPAASGGISAQGGAASTTGGGSLSFGGVAAAGMHAAGGGSKGGETSSSSSGESGAGGAAGEASDVAGAGGELGDVAGAGGSVVVVPPRRCDASAWTVQAFASGPMNAPELMLDGDAQTHWTSGTERAAGQWIEIKLGAGVALLELDLVGSKDNPQDLPSSVRLVLDGREVKSTAQLASGVLKVKFTETPAATARLELTSASSYWWSVAELGGLCK